MSNTTNTKQNKLISLKLFELCSPRFPSGNCIGFVRNSFIPSFILSISLIFLLVFFFLNSLIKMRNHSNWSINVSFCFSRLFRFIDYLSYVPSLCIMFTFFFAQHVYGVCVFVFVYLYCIVCSCAFDFDNIFGIEYFCVFPFVLFVTFIRFIVVIRCVSIVYTAKHSVQSPAPRKKTKKL